MYNIHKIFIISPKGEEILKRFKKTLALALAGSMCVSGMTVYAAGTAEDAGGTPVPYAVDDGLLLDFDMDSMAEGAVINKEMTWRSRWKETPRP